MIRYDSKLNNEINKTIRNFNQKIARLEKNGRELLPDKISKKELKNSVNSRADLKRELKKLQSFSKRGAENIIKTHTGIEMTKYEYQNLRADITRAKKSISMQINAVGKIIPTVYGKSQGFDLASMGDSELQNLKVKRKALEKDIKKLDKNEFERYKKYVNSQIRNIQYKKYVFKDNFVKMITDLGYYSGYDKEKLKEIELKMYKMGVNKFTKMFRQEKSIQAILDYYPISTGNMKGININDISSDVTSLYDNLYENLDEIIKNA